jgi:hypothetical protein
VRVRQLDIVVYESQWKWDAESVLTPGWPQVEAAIRALDRFYRPFVHLFMGEPQLEKDYMSVIGGKGAYWVGATIGEQDILCLTDPGRGTETIDLWTSDQGFSAGARHVCSDTNVVLMAAQYFFAHGKYHPDLMWEPDAAA